MPRGKQKKAKGSSKEHKITKEDWQTMEAFKSFIISDPEDSTIEYKFWEGDTVAILPAECTPGSGIQEHDYWVGTITGIRAWVDAVNDSNEVWARVQWLYSGKDAHGAVNSFNPDHCGRFERLWADTHDYVTVEAFNDIVKVFNLRDDDPEVPFIPRGKFFSRYTIKPKLYRITPKVGENSCICNEPYSPDDDSEQGLMHFCPRPQCRKWYHLTCLTEQDPPAHCSARAWGLRLMATSPDDDLKECLYQRIPGSPSKRTRKSMTKDANRTDDSDATLAALLNDLPKNLVTTAQQPIVRGARYAAGGVSGNVRAVVNARRLLLNCLAHWDLPDDWEDIILGEGSSKTTFGAMVVRIKGRKSPIPLLCPQCQSAI
ncbi:hypothetical protein BKA70DRAFT_602404 [Coprinopsis sp. MPI-PUGE-AT-0042]|nr:hypothetical protein BKA70DRAFT_602404 [Coprinopsis sp. MPI-PUGE-AT-0042]